MSDLDPALRPNSKDSGVQSRVVSPAHQDRREAAVKVIQERLARLEPLITEYDQLAHEEDRSRDAATGWHVVAPQNSRASHAPGFMELPKTVRDKTGAMVQDIQNGREQAKMQHLVAHGTQAGTFVKMVAEGQINESHFGDFLIGSYGAGGEAESGFWQDQPVWLVMPLSEEGLKFPIPLDRVTVVVPNPKGEKVILTSLINKLQAGKIEGVGTFIVGLRELGNSMNTNSLHLPSERPLAQLI